MSGSAPAGEIWSLDSDCAGGLIHVHREPIGVRFAPIGQTGSDTWPSWSDLFDPPEEEPAAEPPTDGPLAARMRPRSSTSSSGQEHLLGEGSALRTVARVRASRTRWSSTGRPAPARRRSRGSRAEHADAAFEELSAVEAGPRRGARGDRARPRAPRRGGRAHDLLPRRDPPLQQGPAGRAAARGRGGPGHADRRDDREPVLRGQLRAALARAGLRAARADRRGRRGAAAPRARRGECGAARSTTTCIDVPRRALRRRRAHRAQRARARAATTRRARASARRRSPTPRTRCSARPCSTTRAATSTTTTSRPGSSPRAARTPTPRSTTSRRCSRAARTRASSRGGWSSSPPRTSATPTRRRCRSPSPRRTRSSTSGCPRRTYALAQAAIYLSLAPKSNAADARARRARARTSASTAPSRRPRRCARPPTRAREQLGRGSGYDYPHDHPGHVNDQEHLPEGLEACASTPDDAEPECASGWPERLRRRAGAMRPDVAIPAAPPPPGTGAIARASRAARSSVRRRGGRPPGGRAGAARPAAVGGCAGRGARPLPAPRGAGAMLDELDELAPLLADETAGRPRTEALLPELLPAVARAARAWPTTGPRALGDRRLGRIAPLRAAGARGSCSRRSASSGCAAARASPWAEPLLETAAALLAGNARGARRRAPLAGERLRGAFQRARRPGRADRRLRGAERGR